MTTANPSPSKGQPPVGRAALFGLCPECGGKTLFNGPVQFHDRCSACGLDYSRYNVGDGPAAFLTLIVGALIIILALTLDAFLEPPLWLYVIILVPVTAGAVVLGLRITKAWLIAAEHQRQAAEGRLAGGDDDA